MKSIANAATGTQSMALENSDVGPFVIPDGAFIYIGRPATPLSDEVIKYLESILRPIPGVVEAHIPQVYIPTAMDSPKQVLFLLAEEINDSLISHIAEIQNYCLQSYKIRLDVLPLSKESPLWEDVRNTKMHFYLSP